MFTFTRKTAVAGYILASLVVSIPSLAPTFADTEPAPPTPGIPAVDVPQTCTVIDTDSGSHTYSGAYRGICALEAARQNAIVSAYTLQNFSFGLFLASLNGTTPGSTEYWALYQNGAEASVGLTDLVVAQNDIITFQLTDWMTSTTIGSPVQFSIRSLLSSESSSGTKPEFLKARPFDTRAALDFLAHNQRNDGSFGPLLFSDWAVFAFASADGETCSASCEEARQKLRAYIQSVTPRLNLVTDYERHAMALMALGIDPYAGTGTDYITPIVEAFDGSQIGDPLLVNDDIFAVFPLLHAEYAPNESLPQAILAFILPKQKQDGSWEGSVDLTAAAIQALALFPENAEARAAAERAETFLRRTQNESGTFGSNSFSLSWVLQAAAARGDAAADWEKSGLTPLGHLGVLQQEDGGVEPSSAGFETRLWATSYAVPAATMHTWSSLMTSFQKPAPITTPAEEQLAAATLVAERIAPGDVSTFESFVEEAASTTPTTTAAQAAAAAVTATNGAYVVYLLLLLGLILGFALLFWNSLVSFFDSRP